MKKTHRIEEFGSILSIPYTLPETDSLKATLKIGLNAPKGNVNRIPLPSIFRCELVVGFREGISSIAKSQALYKFFIYYWHPCVGRSNSMRLKIHLISLRCFFGFGSKNGSGGGGWITHLFFFEIIHKSNWIIYFLGDVWCVDVICKVTQSSSRGFDMKKQSWFPSSEKTWPSVCKLSEIT